MLILNEIVVEINWKKNFYIDIIHDLIDCYFILLYYFNNIFMIQIFQFLYFMPLHYIICPTIN
jgi:hypothetical protein